MVVVVCCCCCSCSCSYCLMLLLLFVVCCCCLCWCCFCCCLLFVVVCCLLCVVVVVLITIMLLFVVCCFCRCLIFHARQGVKRQCCRDCSRSRDHWLSHSVAATAVIEWEKGVALAVHERCRDCGASQKTFGVVFQSLGAPGVPLPNTSCSRSS